MAGPVASPEGWGLGTSLFQGHLPGAQCLHDPGAPPVGSGQVLTARAPAVSGSRVTYPGVPMWQWPGVPPAAGQDVVLGLGRVDAHQCFWVVPQVFQS